jgi:hypothetical protein
MSHSLQFELTEEQLEALGCLLPGDRNALSVIPDFNAHPVTSDQVKQREWLGKNHQPAPELKNWLQVLAAPQNLLVFQRMTKTDDRIIRLASSGEKYTTLVKSDGNLQVYLEPPEEELINLFQPLQSGEPTGSGSFARLTTREAGVFLALLDRLKLNGVQVETTSRQLADFLAQPLEVLAGQAPLFMLLEMLTLPQTWNEESVERALQTLVAASLMKANPSGHFSLPPEALGLVDQAVETTAVTLLQSSRTDEQEEVVQEQVLCRQSNQGCMTLAVHSAGGVLINPLTPAEFASLAQHLPRQPDLLAGKLPWAAPCPRCGSRTRVGKRHCPQCGALLLAALPAKPLRIL